MKTSHVMHAWKSILSGRAPSLSIEITRECPLRCPGCYAYEPAHLGGAGNITLRELERVLYFARADAGELSHFFMYELVGLRLPPINRGFCDELFIGRSHA